MNNTPIYISHDDNSKLRLLLSAALYPNSNAALIKLRDELDRAVIIDSSAIPSDIVTMESMVEFEDLATGEVDEYMITFPERSNVDEKRLSVLTPIGTALIGCREGDTITWNTPGGARELKILRVRAPAPASAPPGLVSFVAWR